MNASLLRRLDTLSILLLVLWTGMALGFGALAAPALFQHLPSRELAATVAGVLVARLDVLALAAFGLALALVYVPRWLTAKEDATPLGPLQLWTMTAFLALLMTALSAFLVTPRIRQIRAAHQNAASALPSDHPDRLALQRNHGISTTLFMLRMGLALGLAWGVTALRKHDH